MLKRLHIKNVALISELELEFGERLNILSGETGAGKSIIVDSLMLLLGAKYDKTLLRYGAEFGYVEGVFEVSESQKSKMLESGLDDDDTLIVNRKFFDSGKNDIRVNGKTFTASMLKNLMSSFVDIYGQNEYQSLSRASEHLRILDYFVASENAEIFEELKSKYAKYIGIKSQLRELGNNSEREKTIDILRYQIEEIQNAHIKAGEEAEISEKRKLFSFGEKIAQSLSDAANALSEDDRDTSASSRISVAVGALSDISDIKPIFAELYERLNSVAIEVDDIAETIVNEIEDLNFDEREIDKIERRYDTILSLKRKYGPYDKMMTFLGEAREKLDRLENCSEIYEKLCAMREDAVRDLFDLSTELSKKRRNCAEWLSNSIMKELSELGMENSRFEVIFDELPKIEECEDMISSSGFDRPEFYLSPNVGQPLKPLIKIISGGEMSRFMLALKVITSRTDDIGTLIFDEIDTGISGKVGQIVAQKLAGIAQGHQVLCVTHLAQIAAMADTHFYINKEIQNGETYTDVKLLNENAMIEEISRLSGSKGISTQAIDNATEMKNWSNSFKVNYRQKP
ncbi:MAG: DNA repair protein RecN [Clostridia bacterium]|nr:DNA repair protein RecN [Clostridia bacterium]